MTNAEMAILSLIVERSRHGYEIEQVIEEREMRNWTEVGFSSIYYILNNLEEKGLVVGQLEKPIGKGPARKVYHITTVGLEAYQQVTVGICTIIGHNWPIFLRFRGGRGVFTSLGVITMLSPKLGLIILVMPYLFAPIRQVAFGVTLALLSLPFFSWFLSEPLDIEKRVPITLGFVALCLIALLRRLMAPRTPLSKSVHPVELVFNRLIFDRDIRDRKAWISQSRTDVEVIEQSLEQD